MTQEKEHPKSLSKMFEEYISSDHQGPFLVLKNARRERPEVKSRRKFETAEKQISKQRNERKRLDP
jgi:hypothetical protein